MGVSLARDYMRNAAKKSGSESRMISRQSRKCRGQLPRSHLALLTSSRESRNCTKNLWVHREQAPEARHKLAQPVRAGCASSTNPSAVGAALPSARHPSLYPFARMSTEPSYLINGGNGGRSFSSDIKTQQKLSSVDPGLQPRARSAPEGTFLFAPRPFVRQPLLVLLGNWSVPIGPCKNMGNHLTNSGCSRCDQGS